VIGTADQLTDVTGPGLLLSLQGVTGTAAERTGVMGLLLSVQG